MNRIAPKSMPNFVIQSSSELYVERRTKPKTLEKSGNKRHTCGIQNACAAQADANLPQGLFIYKEIKHASEVWTCFFTVSSVLTNFQVRGTCTAREPISVLRSAESRHRIKKNKKIKMNIK